MPNPPPPNIYLELTSEFNEGRFRAIICGGQAVVLHRLAVMSKDGDWILKEDAEALSHVRRVLGSREAHYRFGAPLDERWLSGGWSAHLEFQGAFRVRTDFFTRPPRISEPALRAIWKEQAEQRPPFLDAPTLATMKRTNREKDYAVIGELARVAEDFKSRALHSRSARDLVALALENPDEILRLAKERPLLARIGDGEEVLARLLDEERRAMIRANERRLERFALASQDWAAKWPALDGRIAGLPLSEAHEAIVDAALGVLPFRIEGDGDD